MLTEERHKLILQILEEQGTVAVSELVTAFRASESTIRRDLVILDEKKLLKKIHGGAMRMEEQKFHVEQKVASRKILHTTEKQKIAKRAAALIEDYDVIYIDAGTTTEQMIEYIEAKHVTAVTNGIGHISKLLQKGIGVVILGGTVKAVTEAVIGAHVLTELDKYQFNKGFFGTNGISLDVGYTTPDLEEAMVKEKALKKCNEAYILADRSKLEARSFVKFADLEVAALITEGPVNKQLRELTTIIEVNNND